MGIQVLLDLAVATCSDRVAVGSREDGMTFGELEVISSGAAALIADSGVSHVAFIGLNGPAFVTALFGSAKAGVPIAPLNYRLADDQLNELLTSLDNPLVVSGR